MSFPRYPKYKASGVEWLGSVPEHWEVKRSDSFLTYSRSQLDPKEFQGREVFHYSIPVVQEIGTGQLEDGSEIASGKQVVKEKVVLVSKLNPRKATVCIAEPQKELTLCSTEFVALEPNRCDIRYLSYLVRTECFRQGLESKVTSVTNSHQRANPADIYRFWNAWPVLPEQTAIAEFLDRETGKIDALVAEQQRLIELLRDKRQAVISHAVTKGLNPHARMKPSGIEWLGDVPAHWKIGALAYFARIRSGSTPNRENPAFWGGNIPWVKTGEINYTTIIKTEETITSEALISCSLPLEQPGTLLMALYGQGATRGRVAALGIAATFNQACAAIVPDSRISSGYLQGLLLAAYEFVREIGNETTQMNLNLDFVRSFRVLVPPVREQEAIVELLESESAKFDALTAEAQRAILLLQERRASLISAAITGQIDVRQHALN